MKMDEELYALVYQTTRNFCKHYGLDKSDADDITQETCIAIHLTSINPSKTIDNWNNYIKGIIAKKIFSHFKKQKRGKLTMEQVNYIFDKYDEADTDLIKGQAKYATAIIDDYIKSNPKWLSARNIRLWDLYKLQKYSNIEMMTLMNIKNIQTFYCAKSRLLKKLISIYINLGSST
jgi:DNA-directed RNA polymerase specialized sigma24 family protein